MNRRLYGEENDHENVSIGMNSLGLVKWDQGSLADAKEMFCDSLAMRLRLIDYLGNFAIFNTIGTERIHGEGKDHMYLSIAMNNLGLIKRDQGSLLKRKRYFEIVLQ